MSVTFSVIGGETDLDSMIDSMPEDEDAMYDNMVNVSNANARELLIALGAPGADEYQPCGSLPSPEFARLCMQVVNSNVEDPGRDAVEPLRSADQARFIICGRRPDYIKDTVRRLWALALTAPAGSVISWG